MIKAFNGLFILITIVYLLSLATGVEVPAELMTLGMIIIVGHVFCNLIPDWLRNFNRTDAELLSSAVLAIGLIMLLIMCGQINPESKEIPPIAYAAILGAFCVLPVSRIILKKYFRSKSKGDENGKD